MAERIGKRLAQMREQRGLSQAEVAERAGFTAKYVSEVERGRRNVPLSTLRVLTEVGLRVHVAEVFAGSTRPRTLRGATSGEALAMAGLIERLPVRVRRALGRLLQSLTE